VSEFTDPHRPVPAEPDVDPTSGRGRAVLAHTQPFLLCMVAVGGAVGTAARYGLASAWPTATGHWPTATFVANLVGAGVLGALLEGLARRGPDSVGRQRARLLVGTGFCGALTTFSTLAVETDLLLRGHHIGLALAYAIASVVGGLALTSLGIAGAAGHHRYRMQRVAS